MNTTSRSFRVSGAVAAASIAVLLALLGAGRPGSGPPGRTGLAEVLLANGPDPRLGDRLALFRGLIGDWDAEVAQPQGHGTARTVRGGWHGMWILGGRAIQLMWTVPDCARAPEASGMIGCGITIAFPDSADETWRAVAGNVSRPELTFFSARHRDGDIVMEAEAAPRLRRWVFTDVAPASFRWRAEESSDGGSRWNVVQEMAARRAKEPVSRAEWLFSSGPAEPSRAERPFSDFIGDWDLDAERFQEDGALVRSRGEIHFGWIARGLAIQDVWLSRHGSDWSGGTTLRIFDPEIDEWRSVFAHPAGILAAFVSHHRRDEVVLEKTAPDDFPERWIFSGVRADFFDWRSIESHDGGKNWITTERYRVRRIARP